MWAIVKKTSDKQAITVKPLKIRKGWKTIRIFVSSTFKDFHEEREVLVKEVFPDLRLWCEQRKLRLVECDLRWVGVLLSIIITKKLVLITLKQYIQKYGDLLETLITFF